MGNVKEDPDVTMTLFREGRQMAKAQHAMSGDCRERVDSSWWQHVCNVIFECDETIGMQDFRLSCFFGAGRSLILSIPFTAKLYVNRILQMEIELAYSITTRGISSKAFD